MRRERRHVRRAVRVQRQHIKQRAHHAHEQPVQPQQPARGGEQQSEELVKYLLSGFEDSPEKIWESNIFGKSLSELVNEGLNSKLHKMPDEARAKLQETLERIINEGSGGLICIIL